MSHRSDSPNPYLGESILQVPANSAGALVLQATLVNPSFNLISTVGKSTFSTPLEEGSGLNPVILRRSLRIQDRNRSDYRVTDKSDLRSNRQTQMKEVFDNQDRSSPVHDIVLESHSLAPKTVVYSQSEVVLLDSRPEADSNKISTRTHNPGLDLAEAYFNSLNGGTNVPPLSGFVPPLKCSTTNIVW